jgi:hypothetical protein
MIIFTEPDLHGTRQNFGGMVYVVQAVCADRVFRVRYKIATKNAKGDKNTLRWLGVAYK